jgi:hypothetical protein
MGILKIGSNKFYNMAPWSLVSPVAIRHRS